MKLTLEEQKLLEGTRGEAARLSMEVVVRLGELYGASELIPISGAHIDGCLYAAVGEAGLEFAERLHSLGGKVVVPTTLNATSCDIQKWREHGVNSLFAEKSERMERAYLGMGCIPTWTCAPYQAGVIPRFGQQLAWAESNAIAYVNAVLGARTERYGDYTDICCAIVGRVPKFGLHLKENRRGKILVDCQEISLKDSTYDFALLGYTIGALVKNKIPVLTGIPAWVTGDHLKAFCAAAASSGSLAMFHMVGITPEAPDLDTAFQGSKPEEYIKIDNFLLEESRERLINADETNIDVVVTGCPHLSSPELIELANLLKGETVKTEMWLYTNRTSYEQIKDTWYLKTLERSGVKVIRDTCFVNTDLKKWGFKTVMTDSGKCAHYIPGRTGLKVVFADLKKCVCTALGEN